MTVNTSLWKCPESGHFDSASNNEFPFIPTEMCDDILLFFNTFYRKSIATSLSLLIIDPREISFILHNPLFLYLRAIQGLLVHLGFKVGIERSFVTLETAAGNTH